MKKTYKITGLDCASCASLIEMDFEDAGIKAKCSFQKETLEVEGDTDYTKIKQIITKSGYGLKED